MPLEVVEALDSEESTLSASGGSDKGRLHYYVLGNGTHSEVQSAVLAVNPDVFNNRTIAKSLSLKCLAPNIWDAVFDYGAIAGGPGGGGSGGVARMPRQIGEATWQFDTTGGTQHIDEAIVQTAYGSGEDPAPSVGRAINVTHNGVAGIDIIVPSLTLTITQRFAGSSLTMDYVRTVAGLTGRTNDAPFLGFEIGELLFLGGSGIQPIHYQSNGAAIPGERDVSLQFAVSLNQTALVVAEGLLEVDKKGHEYVWVLYEDEEDVDRVRKYPVGAYVSQVYRSGDMNALGIVNPDQKPAGGS